MRASFLGLEIQKRSVQMAQKALDECPGAGILLHQGTILYAKLMRLIGLHGDLAFKLANVFC